MGGCEGAHHARSIRAGAHWPADHNEAQGPSVAVCQHLLQASSQALHKCLATALGYTIVLLKSLTGEPEVARRVARKHNVNWGGLPFFCWEGKTWRGWVLCWCVALVGRQGITQAGASPIVMSSSRSLRKPSGIFPPKFLRVSVCRPECPCLLPVHRNGVRAGWPRRTGVATTALVVVRLQRLQAVVLPASRRRRG